MNNEQTDMPVIGQINSLDREAQFIQLTLVNQRRGRVYAAPHEVTQAYEEALPTSAFASEAPFYPETAGEFTSRILKNREQLLALSDTIGLNPTWVRSLNSRTNIVGAADQQSFIFGGMFTTLEDYKNAIGNAQAITNALNMSGIRAQTVAYSYPSNDGYKKKATHEGKGDFLVAHRTPPPQLEKVRIWGLGGEREREKSQGVPYEALTIDTSDRLGDIMPKLNQAYTYWKQSHKELTHQEAESVKAAVMEDAFVSLQNPQYIDAVKIWNTRYTARAFGENNNLPIVCGTDLYRNFMVNGVSDWNKFLRHLHDVGLIDVTNPSTAPFKYRNQQGKMQDLVFASPADLTLLVDHRTGQQFTIYELLQKDAYFGLTKEAAYWAVFSGVTERVYGDDNIGREAFEPFVKTQQALQLDGLKPVTFAIRKPLNHLEVSDTDTIFDWYKKAVLE